MAVETVRAAAKNRNTRNATTIPTPWTWKAERRLPSKAAPMTKSATTNRTSTALTLRLRPAHLVRAALAARAKVAAVDAAASAAAADVPAVVAVAVAVVLVVVAAAVVV